MDNKAKVRLIFSGGEIFSLEMGKSLPINKCLRFVFSKSKFKHPYAMSLVFMYDCGVIEDGDTLSSIKYEDNDLIECFVKKATPSKEMKKHLLDEEFELSKFTFLG